MTGISLEYDELKLRDLGVGALLHDIGKIEIDPEILNKSGRLLPEEAVEIKGHPIKGFEILRKNPDISLISAHCAYQHHERFDGSGYPRRLNGEQIHEFAHIVAIADVYDALTSDVSYRRAVPVYEAIAIILKASGTLFDENLVNYFIENIAIYPIGTVVRLNTNQIGVVVRAWGKLALGTYEYEIYNRMTNKIETYLEKDVERYRVRHKYLNEEEMEYQWG
jgi:HD-GYP domain-containing protein (c-di-GMP phosphodiesterase class II)